jgi:DNA polymerase III alpha subunit (gram-positive type)
MLRKPKLYAVFDTETTGLVNNKNPDLSAQPQIIEFAGMIYDREDHSIVHRYEELFNPGKPLPEIITKITGLTDAKLVDAKPFHTAGIDEFFGKADIGVAHNLPFDEAMLRFEYQRLGRKFRLERKACTIENSMHLKGRMLKLQELHETLLGEAFKGAHRAMADVEALARIVAHMIEKDWI